MDKRFTDWANRLAPRRRMIAAAAAALLVLDFFGTTTAAAQEQILFPAVSDAQAVLLQKIRNERVRIDVGIWILGDGEIVQTLINKFTIDKVPVRVLGDRAIIFETDPDTRHSFELLANAGIPIRLRYHPTWYPEIMHWKATIFAGQGLVEFGSANYTSYELKPWSASDFKDESVMFTDDPAIVNAFRTKFDQYLGRHRILQGLGGRLRARNGHHLDGADDDPARPTGTGLPDQHPGNDLGAGGRAEFGDDRGD